MCVGGRRGKGGGRALETHLNQLVQMYMLLDHVAVITSVDDRI